MSKINCRRQVLLSQHHASRGSNSTDFFPGEIRTDWLVDSSLCLTSLQREARIRSNERSPIRHSLRFLLNLIPMIRKEIGWTPIHLRRWLQVNRPDYVWLFP